jgi:hypothetical protein
MLRHRVLVGAGVLALLGAVAGLWVATSFPSPGPGITEENYGRIREGMSREDVEAILGGPPGIYGEDIDWLYERARWAFNEALRPRRALPRGVRLAKPDAPFPGEIWVKGPVAVGIIFDVRNRAVWADLYSDQKHEPGTCDRLRGLLPW